MRLTRRDFVKTTAMSAAAIAAYKASVRSAYAYANSMPLQKFIDPMPLFNVNIPLAALAPTQPYAGVDYYQLTAGAFRERLHSQLPAAGTALYGYRDHRGTAIHKHLGCAIVATKGRPVRFTFTSALPANHILPYDTTIPDPGNGGVLKDRAAVHLHGGLVPWASDGGPFHWQSAGGAVGASVIPWLWDGTLDPLTGLPDTTKKVWDYFYPNEQSARLMWYHDHAIGQTRTNAYAGVATGYIVQDGLDSLVGGVLQNVNGIPFLGQPIIFQDKVFWDPANDPTYSAYVIGAQPGDLWYPWFYDPAIWPIAKGGTPPLPSAVPEFFGDTMLANGIVYPYHNVALGMYRFRLLNACNARFLDLSFVQEDPNVPGEILVQNKNKPTAANVDVWQIGTEGGFLPVPVPLVTAGVPNQPFILGPAERADILVRFNVPGNVILYNVAGAPFPGGAPIFDWYLGNKKTPALTTAGNGPNTRTIMQFRVSNAAGPTFTVPAAIPVASIPTQIDGLNGGLMVNAAAFAAQFPGFTYDPVPVELTLNEVVEPAGFAGAGLNTGRLLTLIGNRANPTALPFGAGGIFYLEAPTESVQYNTLRIWKIYNMTADAHTMHFHLFNVQILGRQRVDKTFLPKAPAVPPLPNELGFKETVVMYPGEATIVAALVEDPLPASIYPRDAATNRPQVPVATAGGTVNSTLPFSPRLQGLGVNGDEYVWHCHILEHEEHDMMRPLVAS